MKRALVVGIDNYPGNELSFCTADADAIATLLQFDEYEFEVQSLLNEEATRRRILDGLSWLRDPTLDLAVLYLSGHGWSTTHGTYFVSHDAVPGDEGVGLGTIPQLLGLDNNGAAQKLMIYDFCHAGAGTTRSAGDGSRLSSRTLRDVLSSSPVGNGSAVIAACTATQVAYEQAELGHGKLTFHLLDGMMGAAANQGKVTAHGLYDYICRGFADDLDQRPAWRGDVDGPIVLSSTFAEQSNPVEPVPDLARIRTIEDEGRAHLESYHHRWSVSLSEWRATGWSSAAMALQELLRWFERQLAALPELSRSATFLELYQSARGRLSQLANIDSGTSTSKGVLDRVIGAGAFGSVWHVANTTEVDAAYKVYHPGDLHLSDKLSRFERGFRAMQQLSHEHIVKVFEYTQAPVGFYMQYIDGPNLRKLAPASTLDEPEQIELLVTLADAILHAHDRGVIHRDIKPENIVSSFVEDRQIWFPFLTDFDLAWFSTATQVTKEGFGAQFYSAPEQFARPNAVESHAKTVDVYAFGQLLFFVLMGTDPQPLGMGKNEEVLRNRLHSWPSPTAAHRLLDLYERCTDYDWRTRAQDFSLVRSMLGAILLTLRNPDQHLSAERFIEELLRSVGGIGVDVDDGSIPSRSGRSTVDISDFRQKSGGKDYSFTITINRLHRVLLSGAQNYASAHQGVSRRIDATLRSVPQTLMQRRAGDTVMSTSFSVARVPASIDGISTLQGAIAGVLAAFESA